MAVSLNELSYANRYTVGDSGPGATYAVLFNTPSGQYTFIPESVLTQGITHNDNTYWFPWVQNNLTSLAQAGQYVDLSTATLSQEEKDPFSSLMSETPSSWGDVLSKRYNASTKGFLIPGASALIDGEVRTAPTSKVGKITGLGKNSAGDLVYTSTGGGGDMYITPDGTLQDPQQPKKSGNPLKRGLQEIGETILELGPVLPIALNAVAPGLGTALAVGTQVGLGDAKGAVTSFVLGNALQTALPSTGSLVGDAALTSGVEAALTGGDPVKAALLGGANAGLSGSFAPDSTTADYYDFEVDSFADTVPPADYDFKPDYSLTSGVSTPSEGFQAPPMVGDVFNEDGSVDYSLSVPSQDMGFKYTGIPSLSEMGGGQGLVANVPEGTVSQTGFIPTLPNVVLGDPNSFINKEGGTGAEGMSDAQKKLLEQALKALLTTGAASAVTQPSTSPSTFAPYQTASTMPVYDQAYFDAVQGNYNALAPQGLMADVATPLQQWYAPEMSITERLFGGKL